MSKTLPTGIRFDEDDLKICLLHSKQKTKQGLVSWLCKNYADMYRVKVDNPFVQKSTPIYHETKNEQPKQDEPLTFYPPQPQRQILRSFEYYQNAKVECENAEDWATLKEEIMNSHLSTKQKYLLTI